MCPLGLDFKQISLNSVCDLQIYLPSDAGVFVDKDSSVNGIEKPQANR